MTITPTPEQFLASTEPDEEEISEFEKPADVDPLTSVAQTLAQMLELLQGKAAESDEHNELVELLDTRDQAYDDLYEKHAVLAELVEEIRTIVKPSTSKLANSVREAIERWANPMVPETDKTSAETRGGYGSGPSLPSVTAMGGKEPTPMPGESAPGSKAPAHDAPVEEWRAFAREQGYLDPMPDTMNRSQIRTLLGIEQPAADADQ